MLSAFGSRTVPSSRSARGHIGSSFALVTESPLANKVTSWPRATSSSVSHEMTRSVPPYSVGGTASVRGATCAIRMERNSSACRFERKPYVQPVASEWRLTCDNGCAALRSQFFERMRQIFLKTVVRQTMFQRTGERGHVSDGRRHLPLSGPALRFLWRSCAPPSDCAHGDPAGRAGRRGLLGEHTIWREFLVDVLSEGPGMPAAPGLPFRFSYCAWPPTIFCGGSRAGSRARLSSK